MTEENKTTFLSGAFNRASEFSENVKNKALGLTGAFMGRATEFGMYAVTGAASSGVIVGGAVAAAASVPYLQAIALTGAMSLPFSIPIGYMIMDRAGIDIDNIGENVENYFNNKRTDLVQNDYYNRPQM